VRVSPQNVVDDVRVLLEQIHKSLPGEVLATAGGLVLNDPDSLFVHFCLFQCIFQPIKLAERIRTAAQYFV